jgi:hypothetical protein
MRRLLILVVLTAAALAAASNGSALTAGTTISCSFSPDIGTPAWADATGAPVGTKTVCSKTTLAFDHFDLQCRDGQQYRVPMFFGTAEIDFYRGQATFGGAGALRPNASPAFSIVLAAGFVEDDDHVAPLGTACNP